MRASLTELKAICTKQTLPSEAEAPSRHHDASKLPDRHESEQRQRPDRFACCWEALVQALSFPAPGQARAHRAFRVASDPVKAVARRLDRLPLLGGRRSRPSPGVGVPLPGGCSHDLDTGRTPDGCPYRTLAATRTPAQRCPRNANAGLQSSATSALGFARHACRVSASNALARTRARTPVNGSTDLRSPAGQLRLTYLQPWR